MISRYQDPEIKQIWEFKNQIKIWTQIEQIVLTGWYLNKLIPETDYFKLKNLTVPKVESIIQNENLSRHQIIGFIEALSENLGPERKWIHFGLTSNDVLDTTQNYLSKLSLKIVLNQVDELINILKKRAFDDKYVLMIGRTHGRFAEPITVGLFFARFAAELKRHYQRLLVACDEIAVAKISGATGTYTHLPFDIEQLVAKRMEMKPSTISTQIVPRDHLIAMFQAGTNLATTLEKMAIDLRTGQRSEINEFQEQFQKGQQGSSAMPHKINPITLENVCGLINVLRGISSSVYRTNLLWNERDLTNSSIERIILPDFFHILVNVLKKMVKIITNLKINYSQIKLNLAKAKNIYSQKLLLKLIEKSHLDRQTSYKLVQDAINHLSINQPNLALILKTHPISKYLTDAEIKFCLDLKNLMPKVNQIYQRIFTDYDKYEKI